ncbi:MULTISPECIES: amino acid ABC transporter substrate-binding protein [unclassified Streptococcus]|uniref:amino acid ABC transporter substrate-binding protein n=1 Tax=unclassified Streptococcus TaxID=2608887 RepID=UPI001071F51A|nr:MULTISPECIES: amino acid ABC transporter substrate-binding protein [unclassified Streptococcus]MBF0786705.1 amino acid ABC transporter substrate-binding protein [Streptococcus sp. 19428wC2_LYSM12]MCQ9211687.1 amino acid ABC transporter substrate-binding protein [Streptococcus sp. B01]MCQ9213124.1 amino acid ABC transporter substrate-binding protein [Streptococcus sp. O1]TFV06455.1 amino acid ABC transporter substrate-binding protein [Streptococcus sp. LYSM12]
MKKLVVWIVGLVASVVLVACSSTSQKQAETAGSLLEQIKEKGVLKVGTEGTYVPYTYHDESGKLVGYDVEVAEKVAEKLGVKAEFIETEWDSIIAGLDAGRFDVIANQVGVTDERREKYDFSTPYTYIYGALITQKDEKTITSFADIRGKKSANSLTSNWAEVAKSKGAEIVGVDGFQQAIELLASKRVDVTINDNVAYLDYIKQHPEAPVKVVALSDDVQATALPVVKGNDDLVKAIDRALKELADEGVLTELSKKYFGDDVSQMKK